MKQALMAASFVLQAAGAVAQASQAKAAARYQGEMARRESEMAIANAERVRESAEEALTAQQAETTRLGEQKKSDDARRADRESAELVALANERGQLGTTTFLRQTQQLYYFNEIDAARMDYDVKNRVASLQRDKEQVVEDQARTLNAASLQAYSASVNQKLATAQASKQALFGVAGAAMKIGGKAYEMKTMQDIANNIGKVS
jgi:hypothetical protein